VLKRPGRLTAAGIVATGTTSGERMHKARHTAGQRVLDATGNLKAVQKLLGHSSIHTTGEIYADWDIDQLARTLADVLTDDGEQGQEIRSRRENRKTPLCGAFRQKVETAGIEPASAVA
jgi:Phage integrase family